ncbi:hypothetical protein L6R44_10395 [Enterobacter cloacae complex sp. ECC445]|uniref:hypothetical protein n=1 Tax=Enterobacter cloacae complex sp. ECC445 TaxID=2913213 RepID=UPI001F20CF96|nr:hypothetical protein [Enterobacter cloacae complex sp. ECC445]MCG0456514.1 hypothetical protein [Enterobacter cloacae complex sp. ECC445]MCW1830000.1 hypothetical protein [Enterobacter asburiae]
MSLETFFILFVLVMVVWRVIRHLKAKKKQKVRLISNGRIIEVAPLVVFDHSVHGELTKEKSSEDKTCMDSFFEEVNEEQNKRNMNYVDAMNNPANPMHDVLFPEK